MFGMSTRYSRQWYRSCCKNLLDKLSTTYKQASKTSEDLSRRCDKLEADLKATTEQLMDTRKKQHGKKIKSRRIKFKSDEKRVDRLSHGEVGELRAMLTHSHKHYSELNGMLREFLKIQSREMRKSLGFVPRTVIQVSEICKTVPENPLADFEGYTSWCKITKENCEIQSTKNGCQ